MKQLALCLASILALAACNANSANTPTTSPSQEKVNVAPNTSAGSPSLIGTCSPRSLAICAGAAINSVCHIGPPRWCLPSNELPDGSILCGCQSQSTI